MKEISPVDATILAMLAELAEKPRLEKDDYLDIIDRLSDKTKEMGRLLVALEPQTPITEDMRKAVEAMKQGVVQSRNHSHSRHQGPT